MNDPEPRSIPLGAYRHNKTGKIYEVIGVALHTESDEFLVIYRPNHPHKYEMFARPLDMFTELTMIDGQLRPRFEIIKD